MIQFSRSLAHTKLQFGLVVFLAAFQLTYGQLTGSTTVTENTSSVYTYSDGYAQSGITWTVTGGTITSTYNSGIVYKATVQWGSAGSGYVRFRSFDAVEFLEVTKVAAPTAPTSPTVANYIGYTRLTRGTPPSGETWYWQSTSTGTSTSNSASYIDRTSGTVYYLRSYKSSTGQWSTATTVNYTVTPLSAPTTPTVTNYPGYTRLTRGTPPSGVTWYWQSTSSGMSKTNSSTYVDMTTGTAYYLKAYVSTVDLWSSATTVTYTVTPLGPSFSDENYVHTTTPRIETTDISLLTDQQKMESITYFDGLGRPMQAIGMRNGGAGQDIITQFEYDQYGRQNKDYLPYSATTDIGLYRSDGLIATNAHYLQSKYSADINSGAPNPYSEKEFEASPLNRVLKQAAPGYDWRLGGGHEIEFDYQTNSSSEVRLYAVSLSFANDTYTPTLTGGTTYYGAGELTKTVTKDENHDGTSTKNHTTEEFKDKLGRVILKRAYNSGVSHDTYYVYDDYGNLSYVLPPKSEPQSAKPDATELSELCYQYKYDNRNRLVEKKVPGKDWEYIVYDRLDRPVLTQDGNQRVPSTDEWLFTKYDVYGRVAYTGIFKTNNSRTTLQTTFNSKAVATDNYEEKVSSGTGFGGTYYTNSDYPTAISTTDVLTVNYYDNYTFDKDGLSLPATGDGQAIINYNDANKALTKGLPTGSKVRVLGTSNWITTITGYDTKGRPIYTASNNNYLATTDVVISKLDFVGAVDKTTTAHTKSGTTITTVDTYLYDHQGRLLTQKNKINSLAEETIVSNTYDDLGQLMTKGVGGKTTQGRLQTVDYAYNIRGWLKQINSPTTLGTDLFAFKLNYNTKELGSTNAPLYNGNISEAIWKTANDVGSNKTRGYAYKYDALNRITGADYGVKTIGSYSLASGFDVGIGSYDKNGNIISLWRDDATNGHKIDQLTYTYQAYSNKLNIVSDAILNTASLNEEFKDDYNSTSADTTIDYTYDTNGNMRTDANKGITSNITYNHLNLPTYVALPGGNISYIYDATGVKLKKIVSNGATTVYAGNYVYEKPYGGTETLKFFNHPEGYVDVNGSTYKYVYQYKDHLGNVRLSYEDVNGNYGQVLDSDFESSFDGWEQNGSVNYSLVNGRLKANVNSAYEGVRHPLTGVTTVAGETLTVKVDFDKGNTQSSVRLYLPEYNSSGTLVRYNVLTSNLQTGHSEYTLTMLDAGNSIGYIRIDKDNTNTSTETYFYIDYVSLTRGELVIQEENNYYPFGLKHKGYNDNPISSNIALKFKYNGVELQDELDLNLYSMDMRQYDPAIARWTSIDPVTHHSMSTYTAFNNNPVFWADPRGDTSKNNFLINIFNASSSGMTWYNTGNGGFSTTNPTDDDNNDETEKDEDCCGEAGAERMIRQRMASKMAEQQGGSEKDWYNTFMQIDGEAGYQAAKEVAIFYMGEFTIKVLFKAGRYLYITYRANKAIKAGEFVVNASKFDYFFGRVVTGNANNIARSAQNLKDLTTLGIENETQLMNVFYRARNGTIISTKSTEYGTTIMRSVNIGNKGSINVGFFYEGGNMAATPSVSTIIPKIY